MALLRPTYNPDGWTVQFMGTDGRPLTPVLDALTFEPIHPENTMSFEFTEDHLKNMHQSWDQFSNLLKKVEERWKKAGVTFALPLDDMKGVKAIAFCQSPVAGGVGPRHLHFVLEDGRHLEANSCSMERKLMIAPYLERLEKAFREKCVELWDVTEEQISTMIRFTQSNDIYL